jgi:type III pantothenate kinase
MLLTVDIGNTNIVFGVFAGNELTHTFRAASARDRTPDEYCVLLNQMLAMRGLKTAELAATIIASVVPQLTDVIATAARRCFSHDPIVVGPGMKTGISVKYEDPRGVGADRIVNAVAAYHLVGAGVIVVDFGTATTFDCISPKGEYLGGVIVPGIQVSLEALLHRAAKLSRVEIAVPPRVLGRNTTHALQSGVVHGHAALVDGMVRRLVAELGFPCEVIATGGLAPLIVEHAETVARVDENLTLLGLRLLYERAAGARRAR